MKYRGWPIENGVEQIPLEGETIGLGSSTHEVTEVCMMGSAGPCLILYPGLRVMSAGPERGLGIDWSKSWNERESKFGYRLLRDADGCWRLFDDFDEWTCEDDEHSPEELKAMLEDAESFAKLVEVQRGLPSLHALRQAGKRLHDSIEMLELAERDIAALLWYAFEVEDKTQTRHAAGRLRNSFDSALNLLGHAIFDSLGPDILREFLIDAQEQLESRKSGERDDPDEIPF